MLYYNHREQKKIKKGGVFISLLLQDIASWEKSKKELANVKKEVPKISKNIFGDKVKQDIETKLFTELKAIFETM